MDHQEKPTLNLRMHPKSFLLSKKRLGETASMDQARREIQSLKAKKVLRRENLKKKFKLMMKIQTKTTTIITQTLRKKNNLITQATRCKWEWENLERM